MRPNWQSWFLTPDDAGRDAPDPTETYYITAYLRSGLPIHEPLCVQVWGVETRRLNAMQEGHIFPYDLGRLAARMAKAYTTPLGRPTVAPISKGGTYTGQFLEGLEAEGFRGAVAQEQQLAKPGDTRELGHQERKPTMDNVIGALQRAVRAGECEIQSEAVLRSMMLASVDEDGELQVGPGRRVGHVVCAGLALHALNMRGPSRRSRRKWDSNPVIKARDEARRRARLGGVVMGDQPQEDWGG